MLVIGLTGGIASGKSTVAKKLESLGAKLTDADQISREIVRKGQPAWQEIIRYFGENILLDSGEINRKALANIIFSDLEARAFLNSITHYRIKQIAREQIDTYRREKKVKLIVLDAALLIETGLNQEVEQIWLAACSQETQIKRLMARDNLNYGQAIARIKSQMPLKEKLDYADIIINTEGTIEYTLEQVENLWAKYVAK
ncbi:dephospho-CoA kinase [Bacillota bacterium LX-D]|nr:dephospho-CoA kinase [Bacillota bacterium LX-D]